MSAELIRELRRQANLGARDPMGACDAMFRAADALERAGVEAREHAQGMYDRLRAENEAMRPYALRCGWPGETEWLSDC